MDRMNGDGDTGMETQGEERRLNLEMAGEVGQPESPMHVGTHRHHRRRPSQRQR